jgi:hypothetical protein
MAAEPLPPGAPGGIYREKLRVAWIVEGTIRFYREHLISILTVFIIANLLTWSIQYYSVIRVDAIFEKHNISLGDFVNSPEEVYAEALPLLMDLILLTALVTIAIFLISLLFQAMTIKYVNEHLMGAHATWPECLIAILPRFPILVGATIIAGLIIALGMIALVIPGIVLGLMFILVPQVVLLEGEGPISSLGRSNKLTSGNKWTIFFFFAFWFVVILLFSMILAQLAPGAMADALQLVMGILFSPVIPISMTLVYHRISSDPRVSPIP